nr:alanine aminotransferase 2-like isoform X2 [Solea senegalensis]XP_043899186.1 alanine aminotransferase 2-like isoform X2 [Solea senegalensis]XP_043899187.1 alanine aminotransferase 2-like isoform X2 [Solea senegalensis]XP_043899188.1 alanine aminotransferase 2-like isoform X2 [Solea senegalensis]XP_043899189.1 alanine aminotransferase 2-like isoform X2 [Solea senegalensis]
MSSLDDASPVRVSADCALQSPAEHITQVITQGAQNHFTEVIDVTSAGMKSLSFVRQVLAACLCPQLLTDHSLPQDVRLRAQCLLDACDGGSVGSYSPSAGITHVRQSITDFITTRDAGVPSYSKDIFICVGSQGALMLLVKLLARGEGQTRTGVLTPVPCSPTLPLLLDAAGVKLLPYQLTEERGWATEVDELRRALTAARSHCEPRAIYISNPGNPTGHVQDRTSIEEVIEFAADQGLVLLADEVYQDSVYGPHAHFISYKKVLFEMDPELSQTVQLVSFHSLSSGCMRECGLRAGYMEAINLDPDVMHYFDVMLCFDISAPITGQLALDLMVRPPKPGEPSYDTYTQEILLTKATLSQNAQRAWQVLNDLPGMSCQPAMGGIYLYPRLHLPPEIIEQAKVLQVEADVLFCQMLLQEEGVLVGTGCHRDGDPRRHHLRLCVLVPADALEEALARLRSFQLRLMGRFPHANKGVKDKHRETAMSVNLREPPRGKHI